MLPLNKSEMEILLAALKDCESYYTEDRKWKSASRIDRIHYKLKVNLNRYEEVDEEEEVF